MRLSSARFLASNAAAGTAHFASVSDVGFGGHGRSKPIPRRAGGPSGGRGGSERFDREEVVKETDPRALEFTDLSPKR